MNFEERNNTKKDAIEKKLLGRRNKLVCLRKSEHGIYLGAYEYPGMEILLPKGECKKNYKKGDILSVFLYRDSEDRMTATLNEPLIGMGEIKKLHVNQVTKIGAFLDWGLTKDLFLPFKEMTHKVKEGEDCLVALYMDKSVRLCATMHIYDSLEEPEGFSKNDRVDVTAVEYNEKLGMFVAIEDKYQGLIPNNEIDKEIHPGDTFRCRIINVRDDKKVTLSMRERLPEQMGIDAEIIMKRLEKSGGFLPFHDKTSPEIIKREFSMSKNAYKRAIGRLMKMNKIEIKEDGIYSLPSQQ